MFPMDDEELALTADLQDRDADGRVRVPADMPAAEFKVGRQVFVTDSPRPRPVGGAVGAGNLRGYGVLERGADGWVIRMTSIQVDG